MSYAISKTFCFAAGHFLAPPYHGKCSRMHGHTWRVDVVVNAEILDHCGMVMDFADFAPLAHYIEQRFDHAVVNDTVEQPTCENIARHFYDWCRGRWAVTTVRVWESDTAWGEYGK